MKLNKHNKKGMTLAECIIAMALLGIMSAMLVTVAVAAKRQNLKNYQRSQEMYVQSARIETYNPGLVSADTSRIRVSALISKAASASGNVFNLYAKLGDYELNTTTYGYKALSTGVKDKDAQYTLKALKSEFGTAVEITPNVSRGEYVIRIYNYSGTNLDMELYTDPENGGTLYGADGASAGNNYPKELLNGGIVEIGLRITASDDIFNLELGDIGTIEFDSGLFDAFCETDESGHRTGYVSIYIDNSGQLQSKESYEENVTT